jgi:hypothetical protein
VFPSPWRRSHLELENLPLKETLIVAISPLLLLLFFGKANLNKYYTRKSDLQKHFFLFYIFFVRLRNGVGETFATSRLLDYFYCFIACEKKENENFFTESSVVLSADVA